MKYFISICLVLVVLFSFFFYKNMKRKQLSFYSITCGQGDDEQSFRSVKKIDNNLYDVNEIGIMDTSKCLVREIVP